MSLKKRIQELSKSYGFLDIGFAKAEKLVHAEDRLKNWLAEGHHATMDYMANHFEKRLDPTKLVEGTQTVVVFLYNYYPSKIQRQDGYKISKYAYGKDYHFVIKDKLKEIYKKINEEFGVTGRFFTDSAPILEREWTKLAGLGWIGKNAMLINPKKGSFFFLATMMIDAKIKPNKYIIKDHCGTCTRCIDACPTQAILHDRGGIDGNKCISFLTIENKGEIEPEYKHKMKNWIFGCDICQDVCPWNRFSTPHTESQFNPPEALLQMAKSEWDNLTQENFSKIFQKSAVKRAKFSGLKRNIKVQL